MIMSTTYSVNSYLTGVSAKFMIILLISMMANPSISWSPEEVDPMDYWDHFLDSFTCNLKDLPELDNRETIFDNWRFHYGRAR